MTFLTAWLLLPLLLGTLSAGCGLLLEHLAGIRLPGVLVPPAGLAVLILGAQAATVSDATAELAIPVVLALAVAGFALSLPWDRSGPDWWGVAAAVGVYAVFAAPAALSGEATFAGYIKLDDTSTFLAITDRVMDHGRSVAGLPPSSYEAALDINLAGGYPWGVFLPLGLGHKITGVDSAWLWQPYLAFLGAMLAACLYVLAGTVIQSRAMRAFAAFVGAQAALLFGFALWGGIKEMGAAWLLALLAAVVAPALRAEATPRHLLPAAVASAAMLAVLSFAGALWLIPLLVPALALVLFLRGARPAVRSTVAFAGFAIVLSLPSLIAAKTFRQYSGGELTSASELGNLIHPLKVAQVFGIWPSGDFRIDPERIGLTYLLIAVAAAAGVAGIAWAIGRRAWTVVLYLVGAAGSVVLVAIVGAPWVDAKGYAIASPGFVFIALVGAGALHSRGRSLPAALLAIAITAGVVWGNALAYRDVMLAPHDRFAELEQIGKDVAGEGPTLMTEYEPYGVRHFLRDADPEGASELRRRPVLLKSGGNLDKIEYADIDEFQLSAILIYRTLVLRRSPVASRPPSPYRLVSSGRFYDVWQRPAVTPAIAAHLSLGDDTEPTAVPRCDAVLRLAGRVSENGVLAASARAPVTARVPLSETAHPDSWQSVQGDPSVVIPAGAGAAQSNVVIQSPGRYEFWLGGTFRRRTRVTIDGRPLPARFHGLSHADQYQPMGAVTIAAGVHGVEVEYGGSRLRPGAGGPQFAFGPLMLTRAGAERPITYVPVKEALRLCGRRWDWIEAIDG